jgi:hypothetical protein
MWELDRNKIWGTKATNECKKKKKKKDRQYIHNEPKRLIKR